MAGTITGTRISKQVGSPLPGGEERKKDAAETRGSSETASKSSRQARMLHPRYASGPERAHCDVPAWLFSGSSERIHCLSRAASMAIMPGSWKV